MPKKPMLKNSTTQSNITEDENFVTPTEDIDDTVFELPAGYEDEDGVIHKSFTIREMTGKDEEAISKPELKENGCKLLAVLLERCVLSIGTLTRHELGTEKWRAVIKSLLMADQDYMVLQIRRLSLGDEFEIHHSCPSCKTKLTSFISIDELDNVPFSGNRIVDFELPRGYKDRKGKVHKLGTMRLATGLDREILTPMAKKNRARANTVMLTRLCKFDDGTPITEDTMSDLTVRDREYLGKLMDENLFGVKLETEITCTNCEETFTGNLNATNFI
jgi:hypothetical protein